MTTERRATDVFALTYCTRARAAGASATCPYSLPASARLVGAFGSAEEAARFRAMLPPAPASVYSAIVCVPLCALDSAAAFAHVLETRARRASYTCACNSCTATRSAEALTRTYSGLFHFVHTLDVVASSSDDDDDAAAAAAAAAAAESAPVLERTASSVSALVADADADADADDDGEPPMPTSPSPLDAALALMALEHQ